MGGQPHLHRWWLGLQPCVTHVAPQAPAACSYWWVQSNGKNLNFSSPSRLIDTRPPAIYLQASKPHLSHTDPPQSPSSEGYSCPGDQSLQQTYMDCLAMAPEGRGDPSPISCMSLCYISAPLCLPPVKRISLLVWPQLLSSRDATVPIGREVSPLRRREAAVSPFYR